MAAGLPCISFDFVAGPRDMIEDGVSGVLVEEGNIPVLAQQIRELMESPEKRQVLGANAHTAAQRFRASHIAAKVLDFIGKGRP
jgi:glycosyltransferase involved in cell wall biosynthesis